MQKKILILLLFISCNSKEIKYEIDCDSKMIFRKTNHIILDDLPSKLIDQQKAQNLFKLINRIESFEKVQISIEDAGISKSRCRVNNYIFGDFNPVVDSTYVSNSKDVFLVPASELKALETNPLNYLILFNEDPSSFVIKAGNSSIDFKKEILWKIDNKSIDSNLVDLFISELKKNKYTKKRIKKNPDFYLVTTLNVLEIEIDNGIWVSTSELKDTYLNSVPESLFSAGAFGLGENRKIFNFDRIDNVLIDGFNKKYQVIPKKEYDQIFLNSYFNFIKELQIYFSVVDAKFEPKAKISINNTDLEIGDFYILPNAEIGYLAKYKDRIFVLSEKQVKKLFPKEEVFMVIK